jgi:hypothetical protein
MANLLDLSAQRLVAQALGHFRFVVTILAGIPKPQFNVLSWSLGQVACSHVLGCNGLENNLVTIVLSILPAYTSLFYRGR